MKSITCYFLVILILSMSFLTGCAHDQRINYNDPKTGQTKNMSFKTYGLFSEENRNPNIKYDVSIGNVVWSIILIETIIVPVILLGWYLYEPQYQITSDTPIGMVK